MTRPIPAIRPHRRARRAVLAVAVGPSDTEDLAAP